MLKVEKKKQQAEESSGSYSGAQSAEDYKNAAPIDKEEFDKVWESVMYGMTGGNGVLFTALNTGDLQLDSENHIITLTVLNKLHYNTIFEEKRNLVRALRARIKSNVLDLNLIVDEHKVVVVSKPITDKDVYAYLVKLKPELKLLKERMDLDFE